MISEATGLSGRIVEDVFLYIAAISVFLLVLITFSMVYFVIRYHRKRHPKPEDIEGSVWLEVLWTIIPTFLVLTMFYYGYTGFSTLKKIPAGAMKVHVIARQWSWLFEYENGIRADELRVPVGKPIELRLTSQDVIHSFYMPAFKIKQDAVPGMVNHLWFKPTEVGTYDVLCAEYCGLRHSYMLAKVIVLPEEEFNQWYQKGKEKVAAKIPSRGVQLLQEKGCRACHSVDGTPLVGPTLKGLFGKTVTIMAEGKERQVVADEGYLRKSLLDPNADIVKGFPPIMPSQKGLLTEEEIEEMIGYMKGLK
jgi:cytochrome c oxidase subunit 2